MILKLDSGPGRIVALYDSILQREALAEIGLIIMAGLPNVTSVQQEMDARTVHSSLQITIAVKWY